MKNEDNNPHSPFSAPFLFGSKAKQGDRDRRKFSLRT